MSKITNYHAFHITWHGSTNTKPARIKVKSLRFQQYVWLSTTEVDEHWEDWTVKHLEREGFEMVGMAEYPGNGFILFSSTFKPLTHENN